MKRRFTFLLLFLSAGWLSYAQDCLAPSAGDYLNGNNVQALITGGGSLFFDGENASFQVPVNASVHSIFAQGLWLGGVDPAGNLKVAAQTYGRSSNSSDYFAGPLNEMGAIDAESCQNWDRIWTVYRYQAEAHILDFQDNGAIDNPIPEIMGWPAKGNPYFSGIYGFELPSTAQGLAPFFDRNNDGLYDPMAGDFPMIRQSLAIPEQITWSIFNDAGGLHSQSLSDPLRVEIQLTTWAHKCIDNPQLDNTIFTSYKVINRGAESLDSLHLGLWVDFDLGCFEDDFIGSAPDLNTTFVYNQDNEDEVNCGFGVTGYGDNPPAQAITALSHDLSYMMYYQLNFDGPPATSDPNTTLDYYRLLSGHWRDGTPLTFGGNGYDPSLSNPVTNFAFPGDPNNPDEWSAYNEGLDLGDQRAVSSIYLGALPPGGMEEVDFGYSFFREAGAGHLENVTAMYTGIEDLQGWYDSQFESACGLAAICEEDCVWAGDANADGIANHCDLLAIALGGNVQGPTRAAPYNWSPQNGDNWAEVQSNGANFKHLDADGDGSAAFEDFLLSEQHYNRTRPGYQPPPAVYREGPELVLNAVGSFDFNNLSPGQATALGRIQLTTTVPGLYGLAFSLEYDTAYFEVIHSQSSGYDLGGRIFSTGSAIGTSSGQFDFARVATDGAIGAGLLTLLRIEVKDSFLSPLPADTSLIRFKNIKAIRNDGTEIEIGGATVVARFPGVAVATEEAYGAEDVRLFPNPTTGQLELRFPGLEVEGIEVLDARGRLVWRKESRFINAASLGLQHLPGGVYFVRVQLEGAMVVRQVVLLR
ncbi:MAG: T9SS type A sorting domain-containing protein [Phaeodactylibacter sp.]|nr:T9SS type A sorting domain-containing protein [Phaeodactylibacter sp.]